MLRHSFISAWLGIAACLLNGPGAVSAQDPYSGFIAQTPPLSPSEQKTRFHLPPGFEIELVAAEPEIRKPVNLAFDAQGRLLVTGSIEYPFPAASAAPPRDVISLLEDTDEDGRYDTVTPFVNGLNIPVGVAPVSGGVMAYSIPNIEFFADQDGDDQWDDREVAYTGFGSVDTHGMPNGFTWWIDGWVYACQGQSNHSRVSGRDGLVITLDGGSTFRMRPDGSHIEPFAYGQVNPFGLCFDPLGNLYTADSNSRPGSLLLRGAWYPTLGAPHDGLGFAPQMMEHFHGSTGIAGIVYYAADAYPGEYQETLFIGNPVTGRINHDRIEFRGSTARAIEQPDFLTCDDPWFRPVDLQLGPDGALYIADFYNRIIAHTLVPLDHVERDRERGRIWRVVYRGEKPGNPPSRPAPDFTAASQDELLDWLGHSNLTLRTLATHQLVERMGNRAVSAVRKLITGESQALQRAHGLWVLHRLEALDEVSIQRLAEDSQRVVRVHLLRALAEREDWPRKRDGLRQLVLARLADPDPFVRRVAAGALARHPSPKNVGPLLDLWSATPNEDTMLVHTVRLALRDNLKAQQDVLGVARILDRRPEDLHRLADVSLGLPTSDAAAFLLHHLQQNTFEQRRLEDFLFHVVRFARPTHLPQAFALARTFKSRETVVQAAVLRAVFRSTEGRSAELPVDISQWGYELAGELLASQKERFVFEGLDLAWDLNLRQLDGQLTEMAQRSATDPAVRSFAIDVLAAVSPERAVSVLKGLLENISEPQDIRAKSAEALGKIDRPESRSILSQRLVDAPSRVAVAIARALTHSQESAELLLDLIEQGKAGAHLLQDLVVEQHLQALQLPDWDRRLPPLMRGLPPRDDTLSRLISDRREGFDSASVDLRRGAQVFEDNCSICHQIAGKGTNVGPALDGIGLRGVDRLLEDTLTPSQTVAQIYRSSVIVLENGRIVTGLVTSNEGGMVDVVDAEGRIIRIAVASIEDRRISRLSPMPANVVEKVTEDDFYHVLAYLLSQREPTSTDTE